MYVGPLRRNHLHRLPPSSSLSLMPAPHSLGPVRDHTSCAPMNDLLVCERLATATQGNTLMLTRENVLPPFLGVKWSQV